MKLQLYAYGELKGEMIFPNFRIDNYAKEEGFKRRKILIDGRIDLLKKAFLRGRKSMYPYEIYLIHESRASCSSMKFYRKIKPVKDYRPEGKSTFSHKVSRSNINDLK